MSDLTARVDRDLCAGVRTCMFEAPGAFEADEEGQSAFRIDGEFTDLQLRRAESMCPMAAITLIED